MGCISLHLFTTTLMTFLVCMHRCVFVFVHSSLFARGYQKAGRRRSGIVGVIGRRGRQGRKRRAKKGKGDRWGPCRKKEELTARGNRQTSRNKRKSIACVHTNNRSDLSPLFVCMFILHLHPSPNRFSYPLALSSLLLFCPLPHLPIFLCFLFLLLLISPVHRAWGR